MTDFAAPAGGAGPTDAGGGPAQLGPVEQLTADKAFMARLFNDSAAGIAAARAQWDAAHQLAHPEPDEAAERLDPRGYDVRALPVEDHQPAIRAFSAAGIAHRQVSAILDAGAQHDRWGTMSEAIVEEMAQDTLAQLQRIYGGDADQLLVDAKQLIAELSQRWPGLRAWLHENGRGSSLPVVHAFIAATLMRRTR